MVRRGDRSCTISVQRPRHQRLRFVSPKNSRPFHFWPVTALATADNDDSFGEAQLAQPSIL